MRPGRQVQWLQRHFHRHLLRLRWRVRRRRGEPPCGGRPRGPVVAPLPDGPELPLRRAELLHAADGGRRSQIPGPGGGRVRQPRRQEQHGAGVRPAPWAQLLGHGVHRRREPGVGGGVRGVGGVGVGVPCEHRRRHAVRVRGGAQAAPRRAIPARHGRACPVQI